MKITMTKIGKDFSKSMDMLEKQLTNASKQSIEKMGIKLLEKSTPLAPVDTGELRESGYVKSNGKIIAKGSKTGSIESMGSSSDNNDNLVVDVGYNTPYALRQHEEFPVKRTPGTTWKYLENPLKENLGEFMTDLENDVKKVIK